LSATSLTDDVARKALQALLADGYVVIENLLDQATTADLRNRVQRLLESERLQPYEPEGALEQTGSDERLLGYASGWSLDDAERARLAHRLHARQREEFDTPWPVANDDVCISFIHIPTLYDDGRSQRIFNLINKDPAFAALVEHPLVMAIVDDQLGRDAVLLDVSVNAVGPRSSSGGWHVDSPLTQVPEPFPNFTLSMQTAWMLDDFRFENGATHVGRGSHMTLRKPPGGRGEIDGEVVLEGPAGSLAIWLSQTWHRHGENTTDETRRGVIVQYGRCWVKPFVDLRSPMDQAQAAAMSPRLRYMMGCNASAPVRG
jgi:ectoine hydroxylase-related dioxygenase (phytanoyl-CoA dioxygenase family)